MERRPLTTAIAVAIALLSTAVAVKLARNHGVIDADLGRRVVGAVIGLMVAFYGNFIPKQLGHSRGVESDRRKQQVLRVSGWSFTLAGLAYAAISLALPEEPGFFASIGVVGAAVVITLLYSARCFVARRTNGGPVG